jgi:hypothetical protein
VLCVVCCVLCVVCCVLCVVCCVLCVVCFVLVTTHHLPKTWQVISEYEDRKKYICSYDNNLLTTKFP